MQLVFFSMEAVGTTIVVVAWAASVVWTARDAHRRSGHVALRLGAPLAALVLPFAGAAFYTLAKPCEQREEVRARRLRTRLFEAMLAHEDQERCSECATPLQPEFRCCPACGERVRTTCGGCGQPLRTTWTACPWCTKPLHHVEDAAALSEVA